MTTGKRMEKLGAHIQHPENSIGRRIAGPSLIQVSAVATWMKNPDMLTADLTVDEVVRFAAQLLDAAATVSRVNTETEARR